MVCFGFVCSATIHLSASIHDQFLCGVRSSWGGDSCLAAENEGGLLQRRGSSCKEDAQGIRGSSRSMLQHVSLSVSLSLSLSLSLSIHTNTLTSICVVFRKQNLNGNRWDGLIMQYRKVVTLLWVQKPSSLSKQWGKRWPNSRKSLPRGKEKVSCSSVYID